MFASTFIYSNSEEGWLNRIGLFMFNKPIIKVSFYKNRLIINGKTVKTENPLGYIQKYINQRKYYILGYISYDFKDYTLKNIKKVPKENINMPLIYLNFYKGFTQLNIPAVNSKNKIFKKEYRTSKEEFIKKIQSIKEHIEKGDIYQLNLSHRLDLEGIFFPFAVFLKLIEVQPTPYMMYIVDRDFRVISGSMELFLKKENNRLVSMPIKGTCKIEDDYLSCLVNNPKERAENLMITDLMRNDIGMICRDIKVDKLFEVRRYNTLYQMSSTVSGKLDNNITVKDIIEATFPPGSVTGAPKKKSVEIIEKLEDSRRGIYCGATVLIKPDLDFTMSVAIRQIIFKKNRCYIYVGAGIVADSDPYKEYEETILKAEANIRSLTL